MPPVPSARNLKELPKFRDGLSYLYVEHAVVEREAGGIGIYDQEGLTLAPVAGLGVLFLGPGTRITHAAIRLLAENGCTVAWVGEGIARFYAQGLGDTRSAARLHRQARAWADPALHLEVVLRLYRMRFPEPCRGAHPGAGAGPRGGAGAGELRPLEPGNGRALVRPELRPGQLAGGGPCEPSPFRRGQLPLRPSPRRDCLHGL